MNLFEKTAVMEVVPLETSAKGVSCFAILLLGHLGRDVPVEQLFADLDDEIRPLRNRGYTILATGLFRIPLQEQGTGERSYSSHYFPRDEVQAFFDDRVFPNAKGTYMT